MRSQSAWPCCTLVHLRIFSAAEQMTSPSLHFSLDPIAAIQSWFWKLKLTTRLKESRERQHGGTLSKPQLTAWDKVNLKLFQLFEKEKGEKSICRKTQLWQATAIAEHLWMLTLKLSLLNVLIKYLEANSSPQSVSEQYFSMDKCLQQKLCWGFQQTSLGEVRGLSAEALEIKKAAVIRNQQYNNRTI